MKKNIRRIRNFQKLLICLLIILVSIISYTIGKITNANADDINYEYQSNNIGYDSTNNSLSATNVKDAIDELYSKVGQCPSGYECFTDEEVNSSNVSHTTIISAYTYNENSCVTGEEEACKKTLCYLSKNKNACPSGTIIDYKVNDTEIVRFHVLHDNGTALTLQSQKNTIYNTKWYSFNNHKNGPQIIMAALKTATDDWTNVNDITLLDDMETFNDGISTNNNCPSDVLCLAANDDNGYYYSVLINNTSVGNSVKARMITITETAALGCTGTRKSCPIYLYNYLVRSEDNCRVNEMCTNDTYHLYENSENYGYWTMSTLQVNNYPNEFVAVIANYGGINAYRVADIIMGARAVVVVNK